MARGARPAAFMTYLARASLDFGLEFQFEFHFEPCEFDSELARLSECRQARAQCSGAARACQWVSLCVRTSSRLKSSRKLAERVCARFVVRFACVAAAN